MAKIIGNPWKIVTVNQPVVVNRTLDEVWLLNPKRRYLLNSTQVDVLGDMVETCSNLDNASLYTRLSAGQNIAGTSILTERLRDRGIGDLLFMTGPMAFFNHVCGRTVKIDLYALSDRGQVLTHNDDLNNGCVLLGPLEYDHMRHYESHWFVENVTEYDSEPDQLNVYDALYRQLGFDPATIDSRWKKPRAVCVPADYRHLDQLLKMIWVQKKIDLRRTGYYVVCPFASATIRTMDYTRWLDIIKVLSARRPTIVVGTSRQRLPDCGIGAGTFIQQMAGLGGNVINAVDGTPLRVLMALISRAKAYVGLDSGPLYIAQALRTPAISLWGSHHPGVRLQYDQDYMDLAIWKKQGCPAAPCFSYLDFPAHLCAHGRHQMECDVFAQATANDVLEKLNKIES